MRIHRRRSRSRSRKKKGQQYVCKSRSRRRRQCAVWAEPEFALRLAIRARARFVFRARLLTDARRRSGRYCPRRLPVKSQFRPPSATTFGKLPWHLIDVGIRWALRAQLSTRPAQTRWCPDGSKGWFSSCTAKRSDVRDEWPATEEVFLDTRCRTLKFGRRPP